MQSLSRKTFNIFAEHSRPYAKTVIFMMLGLVFGVAFDTYQPFLFKALFNLLAAGQIGAVPVMLNIVWQIFFIGLGSWAAWRLSGWFLSLYEARVMSDLLNTCFAYMQGHSYTFFSNNFAGSLVRKINRYSRTFEDLADILFQNLAQTTLQIAIIVVVMFFFFPPLAWIILLWATVYIYFNYRFARWKIKYDVARAAQDTKVSGRLADTVSNNINLKLFNGFDREFDEYKAQTQELFRLRRLGWNLGTLSETVQGFLVVILELAVMYGAVLMWRQGKLTVGDFALLQAYLIQIFQQLWNFGRFVRRIYESVADANEMTEILETPHEIRDAAGALDLKVARGKIELRGVNFSYENNPPVLENFNLVISPGERAALIGPSGGGKSTIVKLLLRFTDIQSGEILIDGQNIAKVTQESLRANISLVPQEPILFHRSLMENIRYGQPKATDEQVLQAAKLAHADEFISHFPQGYETYVGERGVKLSGGERQRVAIARAILKNAPILVLDEATSSLDSESEHFIQDALKNLMKNKSVIVIAHRLSTIMQMDRIIVLENGKITEEGKHEELLKAEQGTYQRLWNIQAGGFAQG
ncbi:MAG: ABC transporter ATP-binding protein [Candidatus Doudnabacteria bacterium]|nr:ABC transporter ATP-binding protein [Candidatus Doudnabacteria bacterium]